MGVTVRLDGKRLKDQHSYDIRESSSPLAGGDSSGAVGTINIDVPHQPEAHLLLGKAVTIEDTRLGSTLGTVQSVSSSGGIDQIAATNRLGDLMIETQVQPFGGTLVDAFEYYLSLANIDTGIVVDPAIASRPVTFRGWYGNLWLGMKQMALALDLDLTLVSNNIVLRPIRQFEAVRGRDLDRSFNADGTQLALKQEVIWYTNQYISNYAIWPPNSKWEDADTFSVSAGETVERNIPLASSVTSIVQPTMMNYPGFDPYDMLTSGYAIVGDDNIHVTPSQWAAYGGSLSVSINDDTESLTLTITGASGMVQIDGNPMRTFRVGLSSGDGNVYPALTIVGTGVHFQENSLLLNTGVPPWKTGQEFAPTIDNRFLGNLNDAYRAGTRGARRYAGRTMSIDGTVTAINRRGDKGSATYPPYSFVQGLYDALSYGGVKALNTGKTYADVKAEFYALVEDDFENQAFGNAAGARVYDRTTSRYYRIRTATFANRSEIQFDADDDLTNGDIQAHFDALTYGGVKARPGVSGSTYLEVNLRGMAA